MMIKKKPYLNPFRSITRINNTFGYIYHDNFFIPLQRNWILPWLMFVYEKRRQICGRGISGEMIVQFGDIDEMLYFFDIISERRTQ